MGASDSWYLAETLAESQRKTNGYFEFTWDTPADAVWSEMDCYGSDA